MFWQKFRTIRAQLRINRNERDPDIRKIRDSRWLIRRHEVFQANRESGAEGDRLCDRSANTWRSCWAVPLRLVSKFARGGWPRDFARQGGAGETSDGEPKRLR